MSEFTIDYSGVIQMLEGAKKSLQDMLPIIMRRVIEEIQRLSAAGLNIDGDALQAYSEEYVKQRLAEGKSSRPNLRSTGEMLNSLRVQKSAQNSYYVRSSGINLIKLMNLERTKNYIIMSWGKKLQEIIDDELKRWDFH